MTPAGPDAGSSRGPTVVVVVGTRPEVIKMAPVIRALGRSQGPTRVRLLSTGQHTDLTHGALRTFGLEVDQSLDIMQEGQSLYDVGARCMFGLRDAIRRWRPRMLLVQGDTATVFFSTLASYFEAVAVGHVEAGLRSGDLRSPFPEEGFRRMTGALTELHFAPTPGARANLLREGIAEERIHVTGNTVVDALLDVVERVQKPADPTLAGLLEASTPFALLTAHRRESFGEPIRRIFQAVLRLVEEEPDLHVLYPVHPNPNVTGPATELLSGHARIHLTGPLAYEDVALALRAARLILTDSGGIQEEAPTFGTPLLVLREVTERPEGLRAGVAELVGTDPGRIVGLARSALAEPNSARERRRGANPYGDGKAAIRIARAVEAFVAQDARRGGSEVRRPAPGTEGK